MGRGQAGQGEGSFLLLSSLDKGLGEKMLFGTAGIRGPTDTKVTPAMCLAMGESIATYFSKKGYSSAVVASDGRTHSDSLKASMEAGLMYRGINISDIGRVPTPVAAYASRLLKAPAVVMTASHNPAIDNGIKVFCEGIEISSCDEAAIESIFETHDFSRYEWARCGTLSSRSVSEEYMASVLGYVLRFFPDASLQGMTIIVDGGNGVGPMILESLFSRLGATVIGINDHTSGTFPGRPSEPSPENLYGAIALSDRIHPDVVIAQDGDADRMQLYVPGYGFVPEDTLLAFFADFYSVSGDTVVLSIDTSLRSDHVLEKKGVMVERVPLGYLQHGLKKYGPSFAGEPWKHIHPRLGPWIDGIASAVMMALFLSSRGPDKLFAHIPVYKYKKVNMPLGSVSAENILGRLGKWAESAPDVASVDRTSGIRVNLLDGSWVLVRPSGTEPKLRAIVEGTTRKRYEELQDMLNTIME